MITVSSRYVLNVFALVAGGFLTVAAMAFAPATAGWIAFGVSAAVAALALAGTLATRHLSARFGHGATAVVAIWSLIAALVFAGTALHWLVFAGAIAIALSALADLTVHEATTERVVHALDVRDSADDRVSTHLAA